MQNCLYSVSGKEKYYCTKWNNETLISLMTEKPDTHVQYCNVKSATVKPISLSPLPPPKQSMDKDHCSMPQWVVGI